MRILVLEDEDAKFSQINQLVEEIVPGAEVFRRQNWFDYASSIASTKFDLILLDLLVPRSPKDDTVEDHHASLVSTTRSYESKSFRTPAIVLTRHNLDAGDFVHDLNAVDINVIPFNDHGAWKEALKIKLLAAQPAKTFEFVIVCALEKEANAFETVVDSWGPVKTISGLICREVEIGEYRGAIVRTNRMGLVAAAVISSMAMERFEPKLVCMSGICGGVKNEAEIYDLLVTQTCHQHDAGKWSASGFKSEHYDVQLEVAVHNKLIELCADETLVTSLLDGLNASVKEVPRGKDRVETRVRSDAVTSSGSAVIAEEGQVAKLAVGQRKLAGFDMEVYSVYEAARYAKTQPAFFAAKAVVDDGGKNKGDQFHRIGSLLAARIVAKAIRAGLADIKPNGPG
jgi:nucleoside phosphorylase